MDMIHARACEVRCTEGEKSKGQNVGWEGMGKEEGRESGRAGLGEGGRGDDVCDVVRNLESRDLGKTQNNSARKRNHCG